MDRGTGRAQSSYVRPLATPSALDAALGPRPPPRSPASVVGLEHEYSLSRDGEPVDFRALIHGLAIPGRRLDPGDANAYRCASGLVLTCDAEDAEVVSPPVVVEPGFAADVAAWAAEGWHQLSGVLPPGVEAKGFSTHLSASMPEAVAQRVAALFATTFAPALMLVLDRADSHGVFVRPRPGRIEVCGEHATGPRLGGAAVLVAGGARACAAVVVGAVGPDRLPPVLEVDVRPATGRCGLFVGRHLAFGFDLYAAGRQARLPIQGGGAIGAQAYLELAWRAARLALGTDASNADLDAGIRMVAGSMALGVEEAVGDVAPALGPHLPPSPYGDLLTRRHRPGFTVTPEAATWDFTVFGLRGVRRAFVSVPSTQLGAFLGQLDAGRLDGCSAAFSTPRRPTACSSPTTRPWNPASGTTRSSVPTCWPTSAAPPTATRNSPLWPPKRSRWRASSSRGSRRSPTCVAARASAPPGRASSGTGRSPPAAEVSPLPSRSLPIWTCARPQ